ncbi:hypothetical protein DH2020_044154 [Rehmannia glutinosa]|uniref:dolichyl-phosphate beta-glucosyltransferase n=1 Tax=Rehmannia glutinosa TaxID=99300 RepID=A0ABR0UIK8_REHGL
MGFIWTLVELLSISASVFALGLVAAVVFATYRRKCSHSCHAEAAPIFEDPNSLKPVNCPHILDPAEKYISLIIPAYNEEHRLPGALDETLNYLKERAGKDKSFSYENEPLSGSSLEDPKVGKLISRLLIVVSLQHLSWFICALLACPLVGSEGSIPSWALAGMGLMVVWLKTAFMLEAQGMGLETTVAVVIVDDGSVDGTKKVAFDFVKRYTVENVRVVLLGRNHGKGEAIRKGMLHSRGELLLMLDADGATKVTDLEKLENQIHAVAIKERKFGDSSATDLNLRISDVPIAAFGSRAHLEEKALSTRKWYRNFLMKGFHLVVLLAAGPGIRDTQCGFKMFTRAAARKLFMNIRLKRWCFDVELVYLCKLFRIPMIEISVNWSEIPGSKVNLLSIPNMLWELALMSVGYRTGIWTIHS